MADIYHIWEGKKKGITDLDFANNMRKFLLHLVNEGKMNSFSITGMKLGFRSIADLPEWHMMMEFDNMAQLDKAFERVVPRKGELEKDLKPYKVASVTPVVIDPVTTNLILQITFQYNSNATTKTREALESLVSTTVKNYNNTKLKFIDVSGDFILVN